MGPWLLHVLGWRLTKCPFLMWRTSSEHILLMVRWYDFVGTITMMVERETMSYELSNKILRLWADIRKLGDFGTHIRKDPAPGLISTMSSEHLRKYGKFIENKSKIQKQKSFDRKSCTRFGSTNPKDFTSEGPHFKFDPGLSHSHTQSPHPSRWVVLPRNVDTVWSNHGRTTPLDTYQASNRSERV